MDTSRLKTKALELLKKANVVAWRQNNTPIYDGKINMYRKMVGRKGVPDILGIMPCGKFIGVEIKGDGDKRSDDQVLFMEDVRRNNGYYLFVESNTELLEEFLKQYKLTQSLGNEVDY